MASTNFRVAWAAALLMSVGAAAQTTSARPHMADVSLDDLRATYL